MILLSGNIHAQRGWLQDKCHEIAQIRMHKKEWKLINKIKDDTIFVLSFNASVHSPNKVFPIIIWYHKGDTIIAYDIKPFCKKKYVIIDTTFHFPFSFMQYADYFYADGWDLLRVYCNGKKVLFTPIDYDCILESDSDDTLSMRLQHDFELLRKTMPGWYYRKRINGR